MIPRRRRTGGTGIGRKAQGDAGTLGARPTRRRQDTPRMTTTSKLARDSTPESGAPVVVAVTTDDDRYPRTRQIALELARHAEARLVLYDWDAATILGDPLPTTWSADGPDHQAPSELDVDALEAAGRDAIAGQVAEARQQGVEAAAWLPSEPGADALGAFAAEHGATAVVLPEDLAAKRHLERFREGVMDPVAAIRSRSRARIVVVPRPLTT